jgi:hypothetical protein
LWDIPFACSFCTIMGYPTNTSPSLVGYPTCVLFPQSAPLVGYPACMLFAVIYGTSHQPSPWWDIPLACFSHFVGYPTCMHLLHHRGISHQHVPLTSTGYPTCPL